MKIHVYLTDDDLKKIDIAAKKTKRSRSSYLVFSALLNAKQKVEKWFVNDADKEDSLKIVQNVLNISKQLVQL